LVERDDLREQSHDPILAQDEHLNLLLLEVASEFGQLFRDEHFEDLAVEVETRELGHVDLLKVVVVQKSDRQFKGKDFATVVE